MDVEKILAEKRRRETGTKPLPIIKPQLKVEIVAVKTEKPANQPNLDNAQNTVLNGLEEELATLKKERAVLSSQNSKIIEEVEAKLRKENPLVADEFLKGKLPAQELAEHYAKMQILLEQTTRLYDDIERVKRGEKILYGEPAGVVPGIDQIISNAINVSPQADAIRTYIRSLDALITKTKKKIDAGKPKNPDRLVFWKEKLAMANAKRDDLKMQLKSLK